MTEENSTLEIVLRGFCRYYGVIPPSLKFKFNGALPSAVINKVEEDGLRNILRALGVVGSNGTASEFAVDDWSDFCCSNLLNLRRRASQEQKDTLEYLDERMRDCVYLVGHGLSTADILVYFFLYDTLVNLPIKEREMFLNINRWCDFIQQDKKLTKLLEPIPCYRTRIFI